MIYSNLATFWYHIPESVQFIGKFGIIYPNLAWPSRLRCGQAGWLGRLGVWLGHKIEKIEKNEKLKIAFIGKFGTIYPNLTNS